MTLTPEILVVDCLQISIQVTPKFLSYSRVIDPNMFWKPWSSPDSGHVMSLYCGMEPTFHLLRLGETDLCLVIIVLRFEPERRDDRRFKFGAKFGFKFGGKIEFKSWSWLPTDRLNVSIRWYLEI